MHEYLFLITSENYYGEVKNNLDINTVINFKVDFSTIINYEDCVKILSNIPIDVFVFPISTTKSMIIFYNKKLIFNYVIMFL